MPTAIVPGQTPGHLEVYSVRLPFRCLLYGTQMVQNSCSRLGPRKGSLRGRPRDHLL